MLFSLEPLRASEGDCMLLHWGATDKPLVAVIDGGPGRTFETSLQPRLKEISTTLRQRPLPIHFVMVSHMDSDHIVGVRKMFRVMVREAEAKKPVDQRGFEVKRLWHNVFDDVLGNGVDNYYNTLPAPLQASVEGEPAPDLARRIAEAFEERRNSDVDTAEFEGYAVASILAGHGEGRDLRIDHKFLLDRHAIASLNAPFRADTGHPSLITAEKTPEEIPVEGLKVQIFGPMEAEIDALQAEFDAYIEEKGLNVESVLAAYADKSAKNLSSIVCLIACEEGATRKTILFTGDARGDKILLGLKNAGVMEHKLKVDVLKVPHHGSSRNVEQGFFDAIIADHYVFSGDGKHGNPDRETLEWLTAARGKDAEYNIYFTYLISEIDDERERVKSSRGKVWTSDSDTLAALISELKLQGFKFTVHEGAPLLIELGDELVAW